MVKVKKIRVGILFGGRSAEHEVSLVSARSVIKNLDKKKYIVVPILITKDGKWLFNNAKKSQPISADPTTLSSLDVIFPVLHGTYGEDGTVQGLLELARIPYVGAGVLGSAVGMDKIIQKMIFKANNIPTPGFIFFTTHDKKSSYVSRVMKEIKLPCFVKPANLGSSIGISKVTKRDQITKAINLAFKYDRRVIVEKAISSPMEIECAVLGNDIPKASVLGQIVSSNVFYDYDAKYVDGQSKSIIPAKLSKGVSNDIRRLAVIAFEVLDLAGMARVDFLVTKQGRIYLSEVNTIPGFTSISMYPKLWEASGVKYPALLDKLIDLALARHKVKIKLTSAVKLKKEWYK